MQLTNLEKDEIKNIINNFSSVHNQIEKLESELMKIEKNRKDLMMELHSIRDKEKKLVESLKNKYGENTSLDLESLQLIQT